MGKVLLIGVSAALSVLLSISSAFAEAPPAIPGWTSDSIVSGDGDNNNGVVLQGNDIQYSSPVIAEIDGNSANGLETAVGSANGTVSVVSAQGAVLWSAKTPNFDCGKASGNNKLYSSPAVGELFGNSKQYVVVGYGGLGDASCDGGVIAFDGATGQEAWRFSLLAFAKKERFWAMSHGVFSTPALADTDNDGNMEIGFGSFDRNVYLLNADGTLRWYYNAADTIWSSALFANVDSDANLEMIIGTDISKNTRIRPKTKNGGFVYAFKTQKRKNKHIGFRDSSAYVWQTFLPQVVYSAPIVADVLPSSPGNEIIVGSGCFFPQNSNKKDGKWIKILRATDGKILQTLNTTGCLSSSPAVADIEGRGALNIVATVNGSSRIGGDGKSRISAWRPENPNPIWSVIPRDRGTNDSFGGNFQSPAIADLDGNGSLEVIVANNATVGIFNGIDGTPLTCQVRGCAGTSSYTLFTSKVVKGTPAIADINGDGDLDVVIAGGNSQTDHEGVLYGWTGFSDFLDSYNGSGTPSATPWPMYRGNAQRSGHAN